jgi:CBS domain-containing protein
MRVQDLMTRHVDTVSPEDPAILANDRMWRKSIHHLVVTDGQTVVGILSDLDLPEEIPEDRRVADYMTRPAKVAHPETSLKEAANHMRENHLGCLAVVDAHHRLVGIISISDIEHCEIEGTAHNPKPGLAPPDTHLPPHRRTRRQAPS